MAFPVAIHPELTINHTETFLVTGRDGQADGGRHGLYHRDVRYLARYRFLLNGVEPVLVSAATVDFHMSRSFFTNPILGAFRTLVPRGRLVLVLDRVVDAAGLHEDWHLTNYGHDEMRFTFSLGADATFEDIFDVRAGRTNTRVVFAEWDDRERVARFRYRNSDWERSLAIAIRVPHDERLRYVSSGVEVDLVIPARAEWRMCTSLNFESGVETHRLCTREHGWRRLPAHRLVEMPALRSSSGELARAWDQARVDLTALHFEREGEGWFPAAGVPWFSAVFGRDPLITGYEMVWANPSLAKATLLRLAELQADTRDPYREAEPGKIPHELRIGELAHFRKIPHTPAYTTADATLLYVIVLSETWRWTRDRELLERCLPAAERCIEWARRFGDRDGDGLQEYERSPGYPGYQQMGWKDSPDSVVGDDGRVAASPIALVELEGYWFDALVRMAELLEAVGRDPATLRADAAALRDRIEERYWIEEDGTYAFALDGAKRQVRGIASNAGHLLWSGAASRERAARVARRLLAPDMWSGWGIRTLSTENPAYNPISYHRGSVWPHDCAMIAEGFARYGLRDEAALVADGIVAAAARFENASLPELWSGLPRMPSDFPVLYLDANRPQAWAAASIPSLVRTVLGLAPDAERHRLLIDPAVPESFGEIEIHDVPFLGGRVSLRASGTDFDVIRATGDVEVTRATR